MDLETVMAKNSILSNQLDNAKIEIDRLQKSVGELQSELDVMYKKVLYAEQNEATMKGIMVKNITESNAEKQRLLGEILELKGVIKQLRAS